VARRAARHEDGTRATGENGVDGREREPTAPSAASNDPGETGLSGESKSEKGRLGARGCLRAGFRESPDVGGRVDPLERSECPLGPFRSLDAESPAPERRYGRLDAARRLGMVRPGVVLQNPGSKKAGTCAPAERKRRSPWATIGPCSRVNARPIRRFDRPCVVLLVLFLRNLDSRPSAAPSDTRTPAGSSRQ